MNAPNLRTVIREAISEQIAIVIREEIISALGSGTAPAKPLPTVKYPARRTPKPRRHPGEFTTAVISAIAARDFGKFTTADIVATLKANGTFDRLGIADLSPSRLFSRTSAPISRMGRGFLHHYRSFGVTGHGSGEYAFWMKTSKAAGGKRRTR